MTPPFETTLKEMLNARIPLIYLLTFEEDRALQAIAQVAQSLKTPRKVYTWTLTQGLKGGDLDFTDFDAALEQKTNDKAAIAMALGVGGAAALEALKKVEDMEEPAVFVFKDLHRHIEPGNQQNLSVVRMLRDLVRPLKNSRRTIIITAPELKLPQELQKDVAVVDFAMPTYEYILEDILKPMVEANCKTGRIGIELTEADMEQLAHAATGLTVQEAETAFARAMVDDGKLNASDIEIILEEKRQIIKKSDILEFIKSDYTLEDIGGMENLKNWLRKRDQSWGDAAREYCLPTPKGVLLTGVPGCGKSLAAKAVSAAWGLPLLRLDVGRIFNKYIGESENNIRLAIKTAEAIAPSILWIDEIEKGFAGVGGPSENGTASRIFSTFLTWMQEKTSPVFVIATANNIDTLPPEIMRKGRFDEIFFVDLPTAKERQAILGLHLQKRLKSPKVAGDFKTTPETLAHLAKLTEGYAGAELENVVIAGLFEAFGGHRALRLDDLLKAINNTVPLSVTQAEQIARLRVWASDRAVSASTAADRDGYGCAAPATVPAEAPEINDIRGGRTVDF